MTKSTMKMKKTTISVRIAGLAAVILAMVLLAGVPSAAANGGQTPAVVEAKIDNFSFAPIALTVTAGTTVTWTNRDDIPHTVVSTNDAFKSKVLDTDEKFSYKFDKAGTFDYFCSIHPKMTGKVVVR